MKKSSFWVQVGILGFAFAGMNVLAKGFVRGSIAHTILRDINSHPNPTHIFVGNSLMVIGAHLDTVKATIPASRPLNLAIRGGVPAEYFLLLNQVKTSPNDKPKIYVGFFDQELTRFHRLSWVDLRGTHSICYLTDLEQAIPLIAPNDPVLQWEMRVTNCLPVLVERATFWNRVDLMRWKLGGIGVPPQKTNEFGRVGDFAFLETKEPADFAEQCADSVRNKVPFNPSINRLIQETKKRGASLCFIEMPMPSLHRQKYYNTRQWGAYREHLQSLADQAGAQYINSSQWIPDNQFSDHLHMTAQGGEAFTRKLLPAMKLHNPLASKSQPTKVSIKMRQASA